MENLGSDRLRHAIGFAPGLLLGVMIGFAASGHVGINLTAPGAIETLVAEAAMAQHAAEAQADVHALRRSAKDLLLQIDSPVQAAPSRRAWQARYAVGVTRLDEFEKRATRPRDRELARALRAELVAYDRGLVRALRMIEEGIIAPASATGRAPAVPARDSRS